MSDALRASGRDIFFSISNNSSNNILSEVADLSKVTNSWRTTTDITDSWNSVVANGFKADAWAPYAGPGHWNDPDMLVVGHVGWSKPHPSRLTPYEQYSHVSMWCLTAALCCSAVTSTSSTRSRSDYSPTTKCSTSTRTRSANRPRASRRTATPRSRPGARHARLECPRPARPAKGARPLAAKGPRRFRRPLLDRHRLARRRAGQSLAGKSLTTPGPDSAPTPRRISGSARDSVPPQTAA